MESFNFAKSLRWVVLSSFLILVLGGAVQAQSDDQARAFTEISLEEQLYPTGLLSGLRVDFSIGERSSANIRLGYNLVRHRDLGEHDDERGGGFGGSLGYRYHFNPAFKRWFAGIRSDLWFNSIDWKNNIDEEEEEGGKSDIVVLQPTVELGYILPLGSNGWHLTPAISLGAENQRGDRW